MSVIGLDLSLRSTGVCVIQDGEAECVTIGSRVEAQWWEFPARVEGIVSDVLEWASVAEPAVFIESPAFAAKGRALDRMFGAWWLAVSELVKHGVTVRRVTPGQLKKFATGSGSANKEQVLLAVDRRYPEVAVAGNDEADALVLAVIGSAVYGEPFSRSLTKDQELIVEAVRVDGRGES